MMIPSKFSVDAGLAERYDIHIGVSVVNSNDVGVWADMGVRLVHRRGARTPFLSTPTDEVWVMYIPGMGMVIDFSQNLFPPDLEHQAGDMTRAVFGLFMGSWGGPTRYNHPDTDHRVDHNVYSTFVGRPVLVVPNSMKYFETVLSIPGPEASPGMAEFWDRYGSPDFDIEVSVIQVAWPYPDEPPPGETGVIVDTQRMNNAIELRLGNVGQTDWIERQEYDVDIGI
jgi:hypothetical protein